MFKRVFESQSPQGSETVCVSWQGPGMVPVLPLWASGTRGLRQAITRGRRGGAQGLVHPHCPPIPHPRTER